MNLKSLMILVLSFVMASTSAAYIVPDHGGGHGFERGRGREPGRPAPYPGPDFEQRKVALYRLVANETLNLRQLAGIDYQYQGYFVESVVVDIRRSGVGSRMTLFMDGRSEASILSPIGQVVLTPYAKSKLDRELYNLQLEVRGWAEVETITINLRQGRGPVRPGPDDGRYQPAVDLPIYIYRRTYGSDRIDLTPYINFNQYRGFRVAAIEIEATPLYATGLIDVVINGFNQRPTLQFDRWNVRQTVFPMSAVIGAGAENIVLYTNGDMDISRVNLKLNR